MNKYILFAGETYYAKDGAHDVIGRYESIDLAINIASKLNQKHFDWWHVYNTETMQIVAKSESQAYGVGDD